MCLAFLPLCGCATIEESDDPLEGRCIIALYGVNGLGDRGYNDAICRGVEKAAAQFDCETWHITPQDMDEGKGLLQLLVEELSEEDGEDFLIVTADVGYVTPETMSLIGSSNGCETLILESRETYKGACTVNVPLYGASWMAGQLASRMDGVDKIGIVCARPEYPQLQEAIEGFVSGADGADVSVTDVDFGDSDPFDSADLLYRLSPSLEKTYRMIYPLCGGSTQGLLTYCRENPESSFYTVGIDSDMSRYSEKVPFSIVKNMENVLYKSIERWLTKKRLPSHLEFGMKEGYVEVIVSPKYDNLFPDDVLKKLTEEAVKKEKHYEPAR